MIALRRQIERGLANPWLRPLLIVLLALLLAFVVLHAAHDGNATTGEMGFCLGIVLMLSAILVDLARVPEPPRLMPARPGRAPPAQQTAGERAPESRLLLVPLRR